MEAPALYHVQIFMPRPMLRSAAVAVILVVPAVAGSIRSVPSRRDAVVLYGDRSIALTDTGVDPAESTPSPALWIRKTDLPRINEFELKPQGACRADVCVPVEKSMARGAYFNLTAFARKVGQTFVVDRDARVWSFGEIPLVSGQFVESRVAPDFEVPLNEARSGRPVRLSDFRGKKVLVLTWASW
jgi:hypothetical protein